MTTLIEAVAKKKKGRKHRKARKHEATCYEQCFKSKATKRYFPHRQFGGACTLLKWVVRFNEQHDDTETCRGCMNHDGSQCQVVSGQEEPWHCPELRDHVRYEEIKLYGRAAEQRERSENRGR